MFNFKVVTPEKTYLEGEASMVVLPGIEGDLGILPDHSNIITSIRPGFVNIDSKDNYQFFVEEGFIKFSENELLVVAVGIVDKEEVNNDLFNVIMAKSDFVNQLFSLMKIDLQKSKLYDLLVEVEMPLLKVLSNMELTGIKIDSDLLDSLSVKYNSDLQQIEKKIYSSKKITRI